MITLTMYVWAAVTGKVEYDSWVAFGLALFDLIALSLVGEIITKTF